MNSYQIPTLLIAGATLKASTSPQTASLVTAENSQPQSSAFYQSYPDFLFTPKSHTTPNFALCHVRGGFSNPTQSTFLVEYWRMVTSP